MILARAQAACGRAQWLSTQAQGLVALAQALTQAGAESRRVLVHGQPSRLRREMLHRSAYLRLLARLETMPVIEQAKGVLMAQSGCDQDQAFDLLRRASQRSNVPVRELAAQLVAADEHRIHRMQAHLAAGLSAAEAARAALSEERAGPPQEPAGSAGDGVAGLAQDLAGRLDRLDEPGAQAALDRLFAGFTTETVLRDTLLPYLHHLGDRWERGQASIANEHFASNLLRGRLAGLARGWRQGPRAAGRPRLPPR